MDYGQLAYVGFDFCAIVLNAIILINYYISKRIKTRTSYVFQTLACSALISSVLNTCTVLVLTLFSSYSPAWVTYLFNLSNYIAFNATGLIFLLYTVSIIYENRRIPKSAAAIAVLLAVINAAVIVTFSIILLQNSGRVTEIVSLFRAMIYGCRIASLGVSLVYVIINRKLLTVIQGFNAYFFIAFNVFIAVIQLFTSRLQISDFALAVAIMLIYMTLQRPEDALDGVSGMFNQKTFSNRVSTMVNAGTHFHVFVMEVNNISIVNSMYGMSGGDQVIKEVAVRLKNIIGKNLNLYRLSGARFAIIFNTRGEFTRFTLYYSKLFEKPFIINGMEANLTATACIIDVPEITDKVGELEDLIKYYRSSVNVSDVVIEADKDALEKTRRRERVDFAIQNAIKNALFEVYYQPIYSLKEQKFNSCEALIRLKDPDLGFIPPDEFIPIAEQNGRIVEVGRIVIEEVCRFMIEYKPEQYGLDFIDVNLSVIQCMHPEIIRDIEDTLSRYGITRNRINLEVTETASAQSYALLQSRLNELHSSGFTISLDDFGTGFSSVEYLIKFPFDVVKLDKSLVWAYMSTEKYAPILQHYMPMLHGLGAKIVAEGVETEEMVKALDALGCDYLQGFYYSRPVCKEEFIRFLVKNVDTRTA